MKPIPLFPPSPVLRLPVGYSLPARPSLSYQVTRKGTDWHKVTAMTLLALYAAFIVASGIQCERYLVSLHSQPAKK